MQQHIQHNSQRSGGLNKLLLHCTASMLRSRIAAALVARQASALAFDARFRSKVDGLVARRRGDLLVVGSLGGTVMSIDFTAYFSATETLFAGQSPIVNLDFAPISNERLLLISCTTRVLVVDLSSPAGSTLMQVGPTFITKNACGACFGFKEHGHAIFSPRNRSLLAADSGTALQVKDSAVTA